MLEIIRGDTADIDVTIKDENGSAVDLTNSTVYFTVKRKLSDADSSALIKKTITSHTNPTAGQTRISLTSTDTDIAPGEYFYDISVKFSTGNVMSTKPQKLKVWADVTRTV